MREIIRFAWGHSSLGEFMVAMSDKGLVALELGSSPDSTEEARPIPNRDQLKLFIETNFCHCNGEGVVSLRSFYEDDHGKPVIQPITLKDPLGATGGLAYLRSAFRSTSEQGCVLIKVMSASDGQAEIF